MYRTSYMAFSYLVLEVRGICAGMSQLCLTCWDWPPSFSAGGLVTPHHTPLLGLWSSSFRNQTAWRVKHAVYLILLAQTACTHASGIVSLIVHEFRCWRVQLGFHSSACCLPPFAIQMSAHEASCEANAALLSCVSLEAIIPSTCNSTISYRPLLGQVSS